MATYYSKIHVQYKDGSKASGVKVCMEFTGLLGGFTKDFYTDSHGTAIISHQSRGTAKVYVKGMNKGTINAPAETVVFI